MQYSEYVLILKNVKYMPDDLANALLKYTYIRDALVYPDLMIDMQEFVQDVRQLIENILPKFINWVNEVIQKL